MPLLELPLELLDDICLYLPYTSLLSLRWTSRRLYNDVYSPLPEHWKEVAVLHDPEAKRKARDARQIYRNEKGLIDLDLTRKERAKDPSPADLRRCMFDLLILESWPCFNTTATGRMSYSTYEYSNKIIPHDLYGCHICLRLRNQSAFAIAQTRGDKTRGRYPIKALLDRQEKVEYYVAGLPIETRYCLDCGTKWGKYQKGALLQFIEEEVAEDGGTKLVLGTGIVCRRCGEFKKAGADTKAGLRRLCEECLKYRPI